MSTHDTDTQGGFSHLDPPRASAGTVGIAGAGLSAVPDRSTLERPYQSSAAQAPCASLNAPVGVALRVACLGAGECGIGVRDIEQDDVCEDAGGRVDGAFGDGEPSKGK